MNPNQPGLVLLNKPSGITSFQALGPIKYSIGSKKVGHSGTLDKFANGLMVLFTNKATKLVPYLTEMDKVYKARIQFGTQTDTLDPEGKIIAQAALPSEESLAKVDQTLQQFLGPQNQIPPMYSALHINGKRAYELARSGKDPEMKPRPVIVFRLTLLNLTSEFMDLEVHCSKGTYVRSLARDLALAMGSCGHLSALTRTRVGSIDLAQAVEPKDFIPERDLITGKALASYIPSTDWIEITQDQLEKLAHGTLVTSLVQSIQQRTLSSTWRIKGLLLLFNDQVVGFVEINQGSIELGWNAAQGVL